MKTTIYVIQNVLCALMLNLDCNADEGCPLPSSNQTMSSQHQGLPQLTGCSGIGFWIEGIYMRGFPLLDHLLTQAAVWERQGDKVEASWM